MHVHYMKFHNPTFIKWFKSILMVVAAILLLCSILCGYMLFLLRNNAIQMSSDLTRYIQTNILYLFIKYFFVKTKNCICHSPSASLHVSLIHQKKAIEMQHLPSSIQLPRWPANAALMFLFCFPYNALHAFAEVFPVVTVATSSRNSSRLL